MIRIPLTDDLIKLIVVAGVEPGPDGTGWPWLEQRYNFTLIHGRYAKDAPLVGFEWITPPELEFEHASDITAFLLRLPYNKIIC